MGSATSGPDREQPGALAGVGLDELLREVLGRVESVLEDRARWQLLLDAVVTLAADLGLDELLARIVDIASDLADAEYAALGVLGGTGDQPLRTFIHHGVSPEQARVIGNLPVGHGLLGLIIDRPEPLRLRDIAEHPASYGFPDHHPPMRSFLGVPVRVRGRVFGNLYLTEKRGGGEFSEHDEQIVVALAAAAGVAIENARLHAESALRERWLAVTAELSARLSASVDGPEAMVAVATAARELAGADLGWVMSRRAGEDWTVEAVSGDPARPVDLAELTLSAATADHVLASGEPILRADLEGHLPVGSAAAEHSAILVRLANTTGLAGVLCLAWERGRAGQAADVPSAMPSIFAERVALALQATKVQEDQQRLAVFEDRDRIGRDLHDLVIQRLFAVGLGLQGASRMVDRPDVAERLERAVDDLDETIKEIRRAIFALGSPDEATDVQSEVTRIVDRVRDSLGFRPSLRFEGAVRSRIGPDLAADVLAVLNEALSNVVRHAEATSVEVTLSAGPEIVLTVVDDGVGTSGETVGSGLGNMRQRAARYGGRCDVTAEPGGGTRMGWAVPDRA